MTIFIVILTIRENYRAGNYLQREVKGKQGRILGRSDIEATDRKTDLARQKHCRRAFSKEGPTGEKSRGRKEV